MRDIDYRKASNAELRTVIYDDPLATKWDKWYAKTELDRRQQKRISGRIDKHAGVRR